MIILKRPACCTINLESALKQARAAASDKDVMVAGGSNAVQQYLKAGVLDEILIHLIPVFPGNGTRLFEHLDAEPIELEMMSLIETPDVTHLRFRILNE